MQTTALHARSPRSCAALLPSGLLLALTCALPVQAETSTTKPSTPTATSEGDGHEALVSLTYGVSLAAGDMHARVDDVSLEGFEYCVQMAIKRGWHLGVAANYTHFSYDEGRKTYHLARADVTGNLYRSISVTSISLTNRYYILPSSSPLRLYGGLRTGFVFADATAYVADERFADSPVGFLLVPEAGLTVRLADPLDAVLGYQYNFSTMSFRGVERASYHAVQLGLQVRY